MTLLLLPDRYPNFRSCLDLRDVELTTLEKYNRRNPSSSFWKKERPFLSSTGFLVQRVGLEFWVFPFKLKSLDYEFVKKN